MVFVRDLLMMKKEKERFGRAAQSFLRHPAGGMVFAAARAGVQPHRALDQGSRVMQDSNDFAAYICRNGRPELLHGLQVRTFNHIRTEFGNDFTLDYLDSNNCHVKGDARRNAGKG